MNILDGYFPRRVVTFIHVEDQQLIQAASKKCRRIHPLYLTQVRIVTEIKRVTRYPRRLIT